jgi:hypothetical protein
MSPRPVMQSLIDFSKGIKSKKKSYGNADSCTSCTAELNTILTLKDSFSLSFKYLSRKKLKGDFPTDCLENLSANGLPLYKQKIIVLFPINAHYVI